MAQIRGIEGLSTADVHTQVQQGARFVMYSYCISVLVMTFRRSSAIHFVRAGESRLTPGVPYTVLSFFLGWWGFPWGFIYTPMTIIENLGGGRDVTTDVLNSVR
jgi:hypothetical protein